MKKLFIAVVLVIVANIAFAAKLFDYRGVFPADRSSDAKITNYMLLKKAARIKFEIEDQKQNPETGIIISQVKLTSDPSVVFNESTGIKELELPETGIYEITLLPKVQPGTELRFVLRVVETANLTEEVKDITVKTETVTASETVIAPIASSKIDNSWKPEPAVPVQSPPEKNTPETAPVKADPVLATEPINIAGAVIMPPVDTPEIRAAQTGTESLDTLKVALLSPQKGFFLNTLTGFRLAMPIDTNIGQKFSSEIFHRGADGSEVKVNCSFFSPEPGILSGFLEKVVPGSVYHLKVTDKAEVVLSESFAAFPDLAGEFVQEGNVLKIILKWPRIEGLMPNPAGQVIALNGCEVRINAGDAELMKLEVNEKLLPLGLSGKANYRADLFGLEFSLPVNLVDASGCRLEVLAPIDGNNEKSPVFSMVWQNDKSSAGVDENDDDFSEVEAIYSGEIEGQKTTFSEENVTPLKSLDFQATFQLEKSFSILENASEENLAWPQDLTWDSTGRLWILDSQKRRVLRFTSDGKIMKAFSGKGNTDGLMDLPVAMAVSNDHVFISDSARHAIHKFKMDGSFAGYIKNDPAVGNLIDLPAGICFRKDEMWVADRGNGKILCFNPQGGFLGSFSSTPAAPIVSPVSIRADADSLFILEKNGLVKKFSPMGSFDATFQTGCRDGLGFDVDAWGTIWVCDAEKFQVLRFSSAGSRIAELAAPPAPKPWLPTAVAVRIDGKIAVADAQNKMVHIYSTVK